MFRPWGGVPPLRLRSTRLSLSPLAVNVPVPVSLSEPRIEITLAFSVKSVIEAPAVSAATDLCASKTANGSVDGGFWPSAQTAEIRRETATARRNIHVLRNRDYFCFYRLLRHACRQRKKLKLVLAGFMPAPFEREQDNTVPPSS